MASPTITITSISKTKIGSQPSMDQSIVKFTADQVLKDYEVRANGTGKGVGLLVGDSGLVYASPTTYCSPDLVVKDYLLDLANLLLNPSIDDPSWSKGYNTNIVYTTDGPEIGAKVATFNDANGDGNGYWYCYSNMAPQIPNEKYIIALWVKVDTGYVDIQAYTADNSEVGRVWTENVRVNASDGWVRVIWNPITNPSNSTSDSLSFHWTGLTGKLSISAPFMAILKEQQFEIDDEELQQDGDYRINIYGMNEAGEWTPYE